MKNSTLIKVTCDGYLITQLIAVTGYDITELGNFFE